MRHELIVDEKLVSAFSLPDDLTQGQLEGYEIRVRQVLDKAKEKTDAVLCRAVLSAAFGVGMITDVEQGPQDASGIAGTSARVAWWMTERISEFVGGLKNVPPNS